MVRCRAAFSAVLGTVAGILILASGCAEQAPTAVQLQPAQALFAAKAYQSGAYAISIGPSGGSFSFPIGQIDFPAGAVADETVITAYVDGRTLAVDFQPHMEFPVDAQPILKISFAGLRVNPGSLLFAHTADNGVLIATLRPNVADTVVSVAVEGFSRWAIISE